MAEVPEEEEDRRVLDEPYNPFYNPFHAKPILVKQ
jgi:hypothetical protein